MLLASTYGLAGDISFPSVKVPDLKGKQTKAVLTFSDQDRAIEVRSATGATVSIPYHQIDKCSYEYTTDRNFSEAKNYWLQIEYHEQDAHKVFLVLMTKHNYLRILDALKTHTGIEAEIVGNADKRHRK